MEAWQVVYNHFVWQADAFLHGQASIPYPVAATPTSPGNDFFNDVAPVVDAAGNQTGRGMIPFPPLPAVVLLPFVAIWAMATDQAFLAVVLGALDVGVAFWLLGRLPVRAGLRAALTVFVGAGTVLWYASSLGTTRFLAHVVALGLTRAATPVALGAEGLPVGGLLVGGGLIAASIAASVALHVRGIAWARTLGW